MEHQLVDLQAVRNKAFKTLDQLKNNPGDINQEQLDGFLSSLGDHNDKASGLVDKYNQNADDLD